MKASLGRGVKLMAESGSLAAMKEIAEMYRSGDGVDDDEDQARVWEIRAKEAEKADDLQGKGVLK